MEPTLLVMGARGTHDNYASGDGSRQGKFRVPIRNIGKLMVVLARMRISY